METENNNFMIEADGLKKQYKKIMALRGVDFSVRQGEIVGLVGCNGAGKTTLLKCLCGLVIPEHGEVRIGDADLKTNRAEALSKIGCLIETPAAYPFLSALDNLRLIKNVYKGVTEADITEVLRLVKLEERKKDRVRTYSLGMKQRLGIAQAILHKPAVLLLDEPTNGLDPEGIRELRGILHTIREQTGAAIVISGHNLAELHTVCERFVFMDGGKIIRRARKEEIEGSLEDSFFASVDQAREMQDAE